jgi:hypothetical protein
MARCRRRVGTLALSRSLEALPLECSLFCGYV